MKTTTNYVCCDKCFEKYGGPKSKPDKESRFTFWPDTRFTKLNAIIDLWNGLMFKTPKCCVWHFFKLSWKGLPPAITTDMVRFEDGGDWEIVYARTHFPEITDYINKIRKKRGWELI